MKLLFNETYGDATKVEFFWYNSEIKKISQLATMIQEITKIVKNPVKIETQYYFYTDIINKDAIGDSVRTTILLRKKIDQSYDINFNIADSQMALHMDEILQYKSDLEESL